MPPLVEQLRAVAPNVTVDVSAWNDRVYEGTAAGQIDLALSAEAPPPALDSDVLYEEDFVCLVARTDKIRTRRFSLKQYLNLPHVIVSTWEGQQTPVDRPLAELGLKRHAVLRVPFFVTTIFTVARTDLILTVPRRLGKLAAATADVRAVEPPHEIKGFYLFHGLASAAHCGTCAHLVSRTTADDNADDLSPSSVLNRLAAGCCFWELGV